MGALARYRAHAALFAIGFAVFALASGKRLTKQSSDPHFVYQADAWLNGKLAIDPPPPKGDDWAKVETVGLRDGRTVRGRRLRYHRPPVFRVEGGEHIPLRDVARTIETTHYVSFPPFPAVLLLPNAAIGGRDANDTLPTVVFAALILPLCFSVLRRLAAAGLSERTAAEDVWLTAALAFGTVLFFSAVQGRVWYTAHVVGVLLCLAYVWCSIEARHPILAGVALGCAALTRTPMAFMFPLFLFEAWRVTGGSRDLGRFLPRALRFAAPVAAIAVVAMLYNAARFSEPLEFGHVYLDVMQRKQIEQTGMFSIDYLSRNLAVAFTLLPSFDGVTAPVVAVLDQFAAGAHPKPPLTISGHGLAIWFTTPLVLYVVWPRTKGPLHRPLWLCVVFVALPSLLYQNSGWLQFGYRFSLDYMVFLILLVAVGGRRLGNLGKTLIVWAIAINLFGAVTFGQKWEYYRASRTADYPVVIRH